MTKILKIQDESFQLNFDILGKKKTIKQAMEKDEHTY